jgi:hypothetical protein
MRVDSNVNKIETGGCSKCGGLSYDYDSYWKEYICRACGFTIKSLPANAKISSAGATIIVDNELCTKLGANSEEAIRNNGTIIEKQEKVNTNAIIGHQLSNTLGEISSSGPFVYCAICNKPMMSDGQDISSKEFANNYPFFCTSCDKWYHHQCIPVKSFWSAAPCPYCKKESIEKADLFCHSCNKPQKGVLRDSTWPNFKCSFCNQTISIAITEKVGTGETVLLVLAGAIPAAGLILSFIYNFHEYIKYLFGIFSIPLSLPWITAGVANLLSGMMPSSILEIFGKSPTSHGIKLPIGKAAEFRSMPFAQRIRKVYLFYLENMVYGFAFIVFAALVIYFCTRVANRSH